MLNEVVTKRWVTAFHFHFRILDMTLEDLSFLYRLGTESNLSLSFGELYYCNIQLIVSSEYMFSILLMQVTGLVW